MRRSLLPAPAADMDQKVAAAVDRRDRQTDGWSDVRPMHRPCSAYHADSVNKRQVMHKYTIIKRILHNVQHGSSNSYKIHRGKGERSIAVGDYLIAMGTRKRCAIWDHSATCHLAEVTLPPLPQPNLVLDFATMKGCKAELT